MQKQNSSNKIHGDLSGLRIWLTRQMENNLSLANMIMRHLGQPVCIPLLDVESLLTDSLAASFLSRLAKCSICICISRNAAELMISYLKNYSGLLAAVGPKTAEFLQTSLNKRVLYPSKAPFSSRSLFLSLMTNHSNLRKQYIMIMTGENGDDWLEHALLSQGANVDLVPIYRRVMPSKYYDQIRNMFHTKPKLDIILITCTTSLDNLLLVANKASYSIYDYPLLVVSHRIYAYAIDLGFTTVCVADSMQDNDILTALKKYRCVNAKIC